ncbi:MAG: tRNA (adenosine(37)-N6)-dimethylallyltransferase MiaA [Patescibacteria group bacterium]
MNKLIVILGPTASGKTNLSIKLALSIAEGQRFKKLGIKGVEIISADSRQIYKGMDIGSGKITKKEMRGIPHHLLNVANPKRKFTVAQYQKLALKVIKDIQKRNKLPILVGGTGFYIQSVVDGIIIPEVKPDWKLRKKLEKLSNEELFEKLKKLDPKRAELIDRQNPRRLIRALEIVLTTKKPVPELQRQTSQFSVLQIGIAKSPIELKKLIRKRLLNRLRNQAMINEVKKLHIAGLSWKRLEEFGLEYRFVAQYLSRLQNNRGSSTKSGQNKITYQQMIDKIQIESEHFAKHQMTWFRRHPAPEQVRCGGSKKINWLNNYKKITQTIDNFILK